MARYIDADALLEKLKLQYGEELGWQVTVNMSDVGMMIEDAPTADVAPRAEVEKLQEVNADLNESLRLAAEANKDLQAAVDRLRFNLKAVLDERAEDKAVVAKEIFEEIEEIRGEFLEGKITGADVIVKLFLLKKKYTEDKS
jgi:hypothetical protein